MTLKQHVLSAVIDVWQNPKHTNAIMGTYLNTDAVADAAIKAVAEWLQKDEDFYANVIGIRIANQLKKKETAHEEDRT